MAIGTNEIIGVSAAAFAIAVTGLGSALQMKRIGIIGEGVLAEEQEGGASFGPSLIFTVLAESPVIYGLLIAILILLKVAQGLDYYTALATLAAAMAVAVPGIIAVWGIGVAASASIAAIAEKRSLFGRCLVFVILPETIAIYGLLVSLLILMGTGVIGAGSITSISQAYSTFYVAGIISITGIAGYFLGQMGATAIKSMLRKEGTFIRTLVLAVLPESIAIYGLLVAIMILRDAALL